MRDWRLWRISSRRAGLSESFQTRASTARAGLSGEATGVAKRDDDLVGMIRSLRVGRRSDVRGRTQVMNQMRALILTAPAELREQLRRLSGDQLVDIAVRLRPGPITSPTVATKLVLKLLAHRHQELLIELTTLDKELDQLTAAGAPNPRSLCGVGTDVAGALLVAAGDNPEWMRSESAFSHLCGVAPLSASSGKTTGRHRLNHGGDRQANNALWHIVMVRLASDQPTKDYMARRTRDGLSKKEIIRCLKRYVARDVYRALLPSHELVRAA